MDNIFPLDNLHVIIVPLGSCVIDGSVEVIITFGRVMSSSAAGALIHHTIMTIVNRQLLMMRLKDSKSHLESNKTNLQVDGCGVIS